MLVVRTSDLLSHHNERGLTATQNLRANLGVTAKSQDLVIAQHRPVAQNVIRQPRLTNVVKGRREANQLDLRVGKAQFGRNSGRKVTDPPRVVPGAFLSPTDRSR